MIGKACPAGPNERCKFTSLVSDRPAIAQLNVSSWLERRGDGLRGERTRIVEKQQDTDSKKRQKLGVDYQVSHETIYRSLYIQARGALKKELLEHLRRTRAMRRSRHHTMNTDDHGRICDTVSISERPATAEDRAIPGHWEGDLLFGGANSQIAALVERQTRYVMLVRVASKDTETVVNALIKHAGKLPRNCTDR